MISTTQTGAVRCCSFDGESCKSKIPDCSTLSFSKAQQKCSEFRMRLCTEEELSNNICCGTGCSFDLKLVWYTKGNLFFSSIKILMQKAFLTLKSVILNVNFAESGTKIPQTPPPSTTVRPGIIGCQHRGQCPEGKKCIDYYCSIPPGNHLCDLLLNLAYHITTESQKRLPSAVVYYYYAW